MTVSVCISATRPDTVGAAVRSIVAQTYRDFELVVVAQGPGSRQIARAVKDELGRCNGRVVHDCGRGLSRARNIGVGTASGEIIAMLDDDCEAEPDWLEALVSRFQAQPRIGIIWGAVVAPPKAEQGFGNCPASYPQEVIWDPTLLGHQKPAGFEFAGANFAFTRRAAHRIGPFDEVLGAGGRFPASDDMDYQWRAVEHGIQMLSTPDSIVHHTHGWRYGVRGLWKFQHGYARGNGAYAAKLTLLGDPSGRRVVREHRRLITRQWFERRNPAALAISLRRYMLSAAAYRECLGGFSVDSQYLLRARLSGAVTDRDAHNLASIHPCDISEAAVPRNPELVDVWMAGGETACIGGR